MRNKIDNIRLDVNSEIEDLVKFWHNSKANIGLIDYLGWNQAEYNFWLEKGIPPRKTWNTYFPKVPYPYFLDYLEWLEEKAGRMG